MTDEVIGHAATVVLIDADDYGTMHQHDSRPTHNHHLIKLLMWYTPPVHMHVSSYMRYRKVLSPRSRTLLKHNVKLIDG